MVHKNRTRLVIPAALAGLVLCTGANAATWTVPGDYTTIQAAISAVTTIGGDVILVSAGTYNEKINLEGKAVTVQSEDGPATTIIDATGIGPVDERSVVTCETGEGQSTVIDGFTLTGGLGTDEGLFSVGGAVFNDLTSPTVQNCMIIGNSASLGAGAYNQFGSPRFINCLFSGNTMTSLVQGGSAMYSDLAGPIIINCTFSNNTGPVGGAIHNVQSTPRLISCIVWGHANGSFSGTASNPIVTHSDIEGGWSGTGNIDADPLFVDADGADNTFGTLDDNPRLSPGSPCIDAGDSPSVANDVPFDLGLDLRGVNDPDVPNTGVPTFDIVVDMGCYERQVGGSCTNTCPWDLRGSLPAVPDGQVGFADLNDLLSNWGACP